MRQKKFSAMSLNSTDLSHQKALKLEFQSGSPSNELETYSTQSGEGLIWGIIERLPIDLKR